MNIFLRYIFIILSNLIYSKEKKKIKLKFKLIHTHTQSQYLLFRSLGMCLVFDTNDRGSEKANKEKTKQDLQLLNEVWKIVTKFTDPVVRICYKFINI